MTATITAVYLCGSTLFIQVTAAGDTVALYAIPWSTAQTDGIPGVISAIETAGEAFEQPIPQWCTQLISETVTFA